MSAPAFLDNLLGFETEQLAYLLVFTAILISFSD